jgi:hypothetical protein
MKPDWDKLAKNYAGSKDVLIADVDCTSDEGKPVCDDHGVKGYPTIKYWVKGEQHDYQGGRSYEDLEKFVEENLAGSCSIDDLEESCTEKELKYFEKMKGKGFEEVLKQHGRLDMMKSKKMTPKLTKWLNQRLDILSQMIEAEAPASDKEEL